MTLQTQKKESENRINALLSEVAPWYRGEKVPGLESRLKELSRLRQQINRITGVREESQKQKQHRVTYGKL